MRYIRTKDGKLFDLKKIKDEIRNDEVYNVFYRDYKFKKPKPYHSYSGDHGLIIDYTYKGVADVDFIKKDKTYDSFIWLECDPKGYKESDDITKLFDMLVVDRNDGSIPFLYDPTDGSIGKAEGDDIYGAIRTPCGLKYIAKMNKKGKFEAL